MDKISKHKNEPELANTANEDTLFSNVAQIIEKRKVNLVSAANSQIVLMFWEIGNYINSVILGMKRAEYGKKIVVILSRQLVTKYGKSFEEKNA